ncbi:hypothetical protein TD95_001492 [Thielaviopsis punctulata]|uniref:Aromatic-L-amino-acid decarboxylase n=1 Tax=Thielaviopsis punctulata TaxID=72032 RepID=A0A0F4ZJ44_9PEZI|nr:hypothetical protein TD95_001492 [Thielaviopsis punctulata]
MDTKRYKENAAAAVDDIAAYYDSLPNLRVLSNVQPGYLRPLLPASAPEDPEPFSAIQADMASKIMPGLTHWQSPNFMAFFPASSSDPAMVADMYCNAFTGAHFNWICSPAATELETIVLDWLADAASLPTCFRATGATGGGGVIHGSASEAILTVMVAAREKYITAHTAHLPRGTADADDALEDARAELRSRLVALGSAMTHSSTKKAAQVLGLRYSAVPVHAADGFALRGAALEDTIRNLRARGLHPFFLTANYGTTDVCAVDNFPEIAAALRRVAAWDGEDAGLAAQISDAGRKAQDALRGDVWVHVDAAYAGSALILPEHQNKAGSPSPSAPAVFSEFHSFNFNPHKWLLVNFDCSALYVRRAEYLVDALSIAPPYLRNAFSDAGLVTDYRDWQIPLGRRFRALKLWFVLRMVGLKGLRAHLRKGIALAERLAEKLQSRPDLFEIVYGPCYALVVFRLARSLKANAEEGSAEDKADRHARGNKMVEAINAKGEIYLTPSMPGGEFAIRVSTGGANSDEKHIDRAFDVLVKEAVAATFSAAEV